MAKKKKEILNKEILNKEILNNGLMNVMSADPSSQSDLLAPMGLWYNTTNRILTHNPVLLTNLYKCHGFFQTFIDLPVEDAFRGGIEFKSQQLKPEELKELNDAINKDLRVIKNAIRWQRLYGTGILFVDDYSESQAKLLQKFNRKALEGRKFEFVASDRWECTKLDQALPLNQSCFLYRNQVRISKDRCQVLLGKEAPYYMRNMLGGFGASIMEQVVTSMTKHLKANNVLYELLDEAKIDILKIKDMAATLFQPGGEYKLQQRLSAFAMGKNYKSVGVMDSNDEYDQKQIQFSGFAEAIREVRIAVCADLRMPVSKVWGVGSSGFSSGEDDLENYNAMVEAEVRADARSVVEWAAQLRCIQLFGQEVDDLYFEWNPLRVMSKEQEEIIKDRKLERIMKMRDRGVLGIEAIAKLLVKERLVDLTEGEIIDGAEEIPTGRYGYEDSETI